MHFLHFLTYSTVNVGHDSGPISQEYLTFITAIACQYLHEAAGLFLLGLIIVLECNSALEVFPNC